MSIWFRDHKISLCIGALVLVSLLPLVTAKPQSATVSPKLLYTPACASAAATAACSNNPAGFVVIPAGAQTVVVDTTAVTAGSQIFIQYDETLATPLGIVACNTTGAPGNRYVVAARSAGTSFTIGSSAMISATPACLSYFIVN